MKPRLSKALFTALLAAMVALPCTLADNTLNLYILTGQSNSLGSVKGDPASPAMLTEYSTAGTSDIQLWNASMSKSSAALHDTSVHWTTVAPHLPVYNGNRCMGPEFGFSYMMTKKGWEVNAAKGDTIAIVKASLDGGENDYWLTSKANYKRVVLSVKQALNAIDASQYDHINIAGMMYLQGESNTTANNAGTRYEQLLIDLKRDLADQSYDTSSLSGTSVTIKQEVLDKLTFSFDQNITGEPATWNYGVSDSSVSSGSANELKHIADSREDVAWVYTRDLNKIVPDDGHKVHYDGESEITIGARYAYANAVENGWDVTEGGTISVRSQEFTGAEAYPATSAYAATPAKTVHLNDDAAWWDGNAANKGVVIAVWDISSANRGDTISADFAVGGIRVEDPIIHTVSISNASGSHTLSVGGSGIELQKGNLTVNTALATTADQTWTIANGRSLEVNGLISGDHSVSIATTGTRSTVALMGLGTADTHTWTVGDNIDLILGAAGANATIGSLTLGSGDSISLGGNTIQNITINNLQATQGATFRLNIKGLDAYDQLTLGDTASLGGNIVFNISVGSSMRKGGTFTLVNGWTGGDDFTANITGTTSGITSSFTLQDNALVLVLTGAGDISYAKPWPEGTATTIATTAGLNSVCESADNVKATSGVDSGNVYVFTAASAAASTSQAKYAELDSGVYALWVGAVGSTSVDNNLTVGGDMHMKITGTGANTYKAYGVVNATLTGNAYVEFDAANATFSSVSGLYQANVDGSLTMVFKDGKFGGIVGGATHATASQSVSGGVYMEFDGGTYNGDIYGGNAGEGTITGGTHMLIKGGTFNKFVYGGNNGKGLIQDGVNIVATGDTRFNDGQALIAGNNGPGTIEGGVTLLVDSGSYSYVYGGNNNNDGVIKGGINMTITGGTFANYMVSGSGNGGTINGDIVLTITGGDFHAMNKVDDNKGIYAGSAWGGSVINGNTKVVLKDMDGDNEFVSGSTKYTGTLSGKHNKKATLTGTATLELNNYTADTVYATLKDFDAISAVNGTNTALPGTGSRGDATSISVDGTSTLKMAAEQNNMGTIHGAGRIEITGADNTGNASTAFTLSNDWTGTVALQGMTVGTTYNFSNFGHAGSTIEVNGLGVGSGNKRGIVRGTYDADFVLNKGYLGLDYGMYLTDGYGAADDYIKFTGKWSGDGDFAYTYSAKQVMYFTGDMSEYNGKFIISNQAIIEFGDNHDGVTGRSVTGLGDIKGEHATNFTEIKYNYSNDVSVSNKITGHINFTKKGDGVLTLTATNDYVGTTTVEAGTLKLESLGSTGTGNVIVKSNASLLQENFKLTSGTADSTIVLLEGQGLGATSSDFQSMTVGAGSTLNMTGAISLVNFTTGAGFQGTGTGTLTLSGDSSVGTTGAQSTSSHNYKLTGGTTTFTNVDLTATSGNAIAVDTNGVGLNLSGTVNVSGNISVGQHNTVNITDGAQVKIGSVKYSEIATYWSGGISIGANALLELTDTENYSRVDSFTNNGTLHLNGTELRLHVRKGSSIDFGALEVTGAAKVMVDYSNTTLDITSLTSHGEATLELCNDASARSVHTINLGTAGNTNSQAAFTGVISVTNGSSYDNSSHDAASSVLVLKEENIAANAVINFSSTSPHTNSFSLKVDAAQANVAGITTGALHVDDQPVITSASGTKTLGLTGDGTYEAKVELNNINLDKTGSGTQTFTGDASGVGAISVSGGKLIFKDAGTVNTAMAVQNNGAITMGDKAANHVTITAKENETATVQQGVTFDTNDGGKIGGSGTISNAQLVITDQGLTSGVVLNNTSLTNTGTAKTKIEAKLVDVNYIHDNSGTGDIVYNGNSYTGIEVKKGAVWMKYGATLTGDLNVASAGEFHVGASAALTVDGGAVSIGSPENGKGNLLISNGGSIVLKNGGALTDYTTLADGNGDSHAATLTMGGKEDNAEGVYATISSTANSSNFSLGNSNITISHAAVNVDTAAQNFESNAKLDDSVLTVKGGGSVKVAVNTAEGASNDFVVTDGNATANLGSATEMNIGTLNVGAANSFSAETTASETVTAKVTSEATLAAGSTVNANLVIKGGADTEHSATLSAAGATVSGDIKVEAKATLDASGVAAGTATAAVTVEGTLDMADEAVIKLEDIAVGEKVVIASAANGIKLGNVTLSGLTLSGYSHVDLKVATAVSPVAAYGLMLAGADEVSGPADLTATRVANVVTGASSDTIGAVTLTSNLEQAYINELKAKSLELGLTVGETYLETLMAAADGDGLVTITLLGKDDAVLDLTGMKVSFNGYLGEGDNYAEWTKNEGAAYAVEFIPEPATTTLSLLALAALVSRRRRR